MADAPHLTVAMIVRNEADTICSTLASIESIADQIVVYDTSDDDSTQEAADGFVTDWINAEWEDDFAGARNACLKHVRGNWVLWLDAGETLSAEHAAALQEFVDHDADPTKLYMLIVATDPVGGDDEAEQVGRLRLAPRLDRLEFRGRLGESLEPAALTLGLSLEGLPFRIQRTARDHDPERKQIRAHRDLRLVDMETAAHGPTPKMLNYAGTAHHDLGNMEDAARAYAKAVDTAARGSTEMLEAYYGLLSTLDAIPESAERQVELCLQALDIFPVDAQLLCAMGGYLQRQQRLDLATRSYETAFRFGQVNPVVWHVGRIHEISAVCLGLALQLQGEDEASVKVLGEAVERYPDSPGLKRHLLNAYIRQTRRDDALALVEELDSDGAEALRSAVRGACLAVEENWLAANAYLKVAFDSGCRDPLCLRWHCVTLLRSGQAEGAQEVMAAWEEADPGNIELQSYREMLSEAPESDPAAPQPHAVRTGAQRASNSPS